MKGLHVDSVMKSYGGRKVVSDIFLSCQPGEAVAILGRNGSGKSTLFKIIFGSLSAEQAYIRIDGQVYPVLKPKPIGFLFQDSFLPGHLRVAEILRLLQLQHLETHPLVHAIRRVRVQQLSSGERRLLEVLFLIELPVPYLLLDEPFNGLSPLLKETVKQMIREGVRSGKGIVITDHDYRNVLEITTRGYLMREGTLKPYTDVAALRNGGYLP